MSIGLDWIGSEPLGPRGFVSLLSGAEGMGGGCHPYGTNEKSGGLEAGKQHDRRMQIGLWDGVLQPQMRPVS